MVRKRCVHRACCVTAYLADPHGSAKQATGWSSQSRTVKPQPSTVVPSRVSLSTLPLSEPVQHEALPELRFLKKMEYFYVRVSLPQVQCKHTVKSVKESKVPTSCSVWQRPAAKNPNDGKFTRSACATSTRGSVVLHSTQESAKINPRFDLDTSPCAPGTPHIFLNVTWCVWLLRHAHSPNSHKIITSR